MKKATIVKYYVRDINNSLSEIINARQEISRGDKKYGVYWKFEEVTKMQFLIELERNKKVLCVLTKSNKYIEVDKNNINMFNI